MVFHKKTVRDVPIDNLTVLVRTNFDSPLDETGKLVDDLWIRASLSTIDHLLSRGCKVVVISHHGKPIGRDARYSLEPAASRLAQLLRRDVRFVSDIIGDRVLQAVKQAPKNSITVLENLRFHPGEMANNADFARSLVHSTGARYFVQDGFVVSRAKHASTHAITDFIPSVAGLALEADFYAFLRAMQRAGIKGCIKSPGIEVLLDDRRYIR